MADERQDAPAGAAGGGEFEGPYSAEECGVCAFGHPMNAQGRCEGINADPAYCPPEDGAVSDAG